MRPRSPLAAEVQRLGGQARRPLSSAAVSPVPTQVAPAVGWVLAGESSTFSTVRIAPSSTTLGQPVATAHVREPEPAYGPLCTLALGTQALEAR
jgi:hypothetical protein